MTFSGAQSSSQVAFEFAPIHNYEGQNFLVDSSNQQALVAATTLPWQSYGLNIYGEAASGKTHICKIAQSLVPKLKIIENIGSDFDEIELLQTINSAKENQYNLLITSYAPVTRLGFALPDLTSRLGEFLCLQISAPSEALLYALLARQFLARQISVDDNVLNFLAQRLPRSHATIAQVVEKLDRLSLQEKRNISIPLVKEIIQFDE